MAGKINLKPCPFCGSDDLTIDHLVDDHDWFISCNGCEIQQIANYTEAEAIERWNRRALTIDTDDDFHCEGCGKVIKAGDKYTTTLDGCYLCEEDAPSYQDAVDQWNDRDDGTYDDEEKEAAEGCREALAAHVAVGGSPDDKPFTVME